MKTVNKSKYMEQTSVRRKVTHNLRYDKLIIATDADMDGAHITALIIDLFFELWPELVKHGFLCKLQTPIIRVTQNKKEIEFMSLEDFEKWEKKQTAPYSTFYLKGLGSNDTKYFKNYMFNSEFIKQIIYMEEDDKNFLDIAFDKNKANERKAFIYAD